MTTLYSFDPGAVTGMACGHYSSTEPYTFEWGVAFSFDQLSEMFWNSDLEEYEPVVVERFELNMGNEFKADLEGMQVEGMLRHVFPKIVWQDRDEKGKAGMMDAILQEHGLWQTDKDVDWKDGRDVNDAIIHALVYLRNKNHLPTLRKYFRNG